MLAQAIYEAEIESTDDIERLAQVDGRRTPDVTFAGGCSLGDVLACVLAKTAGAYAARSNDSSRAPEIVDQAA